MERGRRTLVLNEVQSDTRVDGAGVKVVGAECVLWVPLTMGDELGAGAPARQSWSPDRLHRWRTAPQGSEVEAAL